MFNPKFSIFDDWMFGKLSNLLSGSNPPQNSDPILLSIGEPKTPPPDILKDVFNEYYKDWRKYTPSNGTRYFRESVAEYLSRRYPNTPEFFDIDDEINPVPGTRAPLFQIGLLLKDGNKRKDISLVTNPFYHAWRAGGIAANKKIVWMNATSETNWLPETQNIDISILKRSSIMYVASPSNPHGSCASINWLIKTINKCRKYDILLCVDECYADIYREDGMPPPGTVEALDKIGEGSKGVIIFHSLSKRSSAAGLRAGFIAGDKELISRYRQLTSNGGVAISEPQLRAAQALYKDDKHVEKNRGFYDVNFQLSEKILNFKKPQGGFFNFIPVNDDLIATKHLWENHGVKVMPGRYMAHTDNGINPGRNYLRIALVNDETITKKGLQKISKGLQELQ